MHDSAECVKDLLKAANVINRVGIAERKLLLLRSSRVIKRLMETGGGNREISPGDISTLIQNLSISQVYALRSSEATKECLLDTADIISKLRKWSGHRLRPHSR